MLTFYGSFGLQDPSGSLWSGILLQIGGLGPQIGGLRPCAEPNTAPVQQNIGKH